MSRTTQLVCKKCGEYIWIGQNRYIYTSMPEIMKRLNDFLQKHHSLEPCNEHELIFTGYADDGYYEKFNWRNVTNEKEDEGDEE